MFTFLEWIGIICVVLITYKLVKLMFVLVYEYLVVPLTSSVNFKNQGKWALITGATDGIGKAFAEAFAAKDINIILVSRSMSKLENVAQEIENKYNVETKVIEVDFSKTDGTYDKIEKTIFGYDIGILVNNVGLSYPHPEYFLDLPQNNVISSGIINCNIYAVTNMCKIVMPGMVERKRGIIINLSSTAAKIPSPLLTVYGASKAYVEKFSTDLATEYNQMGITVQCLLPGYVATKMSKISKSTWMAPTPKDYVKHALRLTGVRNKTTGYYPHSLLVNAVQSIEYVSPKCATFLIMQVMETLKLRAVKKRNKTNISAIKSKYNTGAGNDINIDVNSNKLQISSCNNNNES